MIKPPKLIACLGLITLAAGFAEASSLVQNSPFLPPLYKQSAAKPEKKDAQIKPDPTRFILKGISKIGPNYLFSIYDSVTKKAAWIEAGVPHNGFTVLKYYPSNKKIQYSWKGNRHTITLPKAQGEPIQLVFINPDNPEQRGISAAANGSERIENGTLTKNTYSTSLTVNERIQNGTLNKNTYSTSLTVNENSPIVFQQRTLTGRQSTYQTSGSTSNLFAGIGSNFPPQEELPTASTGAYKVKRNNNVHNPDGKKPSHMSYAQWVALTHN